MTLFRKVLAWLMLTGAVCIDIAAWAGLVAQGEPPFVLHLSTAALAYEGFNAVQIAHEKE